MTPGFARPRPQYLRLVGQFTNESGGGDLGGAATGTGTDVSNSYPDFLNPGDNTDSGLPGSTTTGGDIVSGDPTSGGGGTGFDNPYQGGGGGGGGGTVPTTPSTPTTPSADASSGGIPTWAWVAGGAGLLGIVAWAVSKRKKKG